MGKIADRFAAKRSPHQIPALHLAELMLRSEEGIANGLSPSASVQGLAERIEGFGVQVHFILEQRREFVDLVLTAARGFIAGQRGGNARVRRFNQLLDDLSSRTYLRDEHDTKAQLFLAPVGLVPDHDATQPLDPESGVILSQKLFRQLAVHEPLGVAVFPIGLDASQWRAAGPAPRFKLLKLFAQATANNRPLATVAPMLLEACEFTAAAGLGARWLPVCVWLKADKLPIRDLAGTDLVTVARAIES